MQGIVLKFKGQELKLQIRDEADQSVMREIFKLREYKIAEKKIAKANVILDVGAHIGFFTLYCRALNPSADIYALEPLSENIGIFKQHLKKNNVEGVKIVEAALAKATEKRKVIITEDKHNNYLDPDCHPRENGDLEECGDSRLRGNDKTREAQAYSLKDFCVKQKIKKIDLLKMDIEGGEYEIIATLDEKDFKKVGAFILEYHEGEKVHGEIESRLRENGFGVQIFPSQFDKTMGFLFAVKP